MKRLLRGTAAGLLAAVLFIPQPVRAVSARCAVVMDSVGGRLLYSRRPDEKSLIASTTKIMTGLLVCETCNVLDTVRIPREAVGIEGSSMYLREGETVTVQDLLYGMLLKSGNDAATALAIYAGGSVEGFAEQMNRKAARLGMTGTHFENPHGLDGRDHRSTARDLGILGTEAMKNPIFARTVATRTVTAAGRKLRNHNRLLWQVPGVDGIKTGYTRAAGRILVSSAIRNGRRLTCVTLNDPEDWKDHGTLLEQGFARYELRQLIRKGQRVGVLPVLEGEPSQVPIVAEGDFSMLALPEERADVILPGPGFLYAPAVAGAPLGLAHVLIGGTPVGKIPVRCGAGAALREPEKTGILKGLKGLFGG